MQAGFFQKDITPPPGVERACDYRKLYLDKMHDPLKARAAVFDNGTTRTAIISIDVCTIPCADFVARIRSEIFRRCGIAPEAVLIAASHTHNGPCTLGHMPSQYQRAPALIRRLALEHSPVIDEFYIEWLARQAAAAAVEADQRRETAVLSFGIGEEATVAFNRRFRMRNGRVFTHPGKGNPDIVSPAGPIDPQVGVIGAWNRRGDLLGCIVNFACHGTTMLNNKTSADWIYYLDHIISAAFGQQAVTVFLNGAAGDITQVDNLSPQPFEVGELWSRRVGMRVGAEAVKALTDDGTITPHQNRRWPLAAHRQVLRIPRRCPNPTQLRDSLREVRLGLKDPQRRKTTAWIFAKEYVLADYLRRRQPLVPVEVQVLQIGPVLIATNPSELFCHLGLQIKAGSPAPITFIAELANGNVGYAPGQAAFQPDGGGYETVLTSYSTLATDAGERIVRATLQMMKNFKPCRLPQHKASAKAGKPWDYGIRGPDGD